MTTQTEPGADIDPKAAQIARANDAFRKGQHCDGALPPGKRLLTAGVIAKGERFAAAAMDTVAAFDRFTEDNDPHGEHDFGAFTLPHDGEDVRLFWKIDLYDAAYEYGAPDPTDIAATRRVLTVMLADEY